MQSPTLLCLNDDKTALFVRKLVLEKEGFRVLTTTTAKEALELMGQEQVDLVIADHLLQDSTGVEVASVMKQRWPRVPIILLSGMVDPPEHRGVIDAFVSKVEGREVLITTIRRLLEPSPNAPGPHETGTPKS